MLGLKQRGSSTQTSASFPDPPRTFPDGAPFPGDAHRQTMQRIIRIAHATEAPQNESMARRAILVERLICEPDAVELTTELVADLGSGRRWLEVNGLQPECRGYDLVLADLSRYWSQSGALRWFRDSLK